MKEAKRKKGERKPQSDKKNPTRRGVLRIGLQIFLRQPPYGHDRGQIRKRGGKGGGPGKARSAFAFIALRVAGRTYPKPEGGGREIRGKEGRERGREVADDTSISTG